MGDSSSRTSSPALQDGGAPTFRCRCDRRSANFFHLLQGSGRQAFHFTQVHINTQRSGSRGAHLQAGILFEQLDESREQVFQFVFAQDADCQAADSRLAVVERQPPTSSKESRSSARLNSSRSSMMPGGGELRPAARFFEQVAVGRDQVGEAAQVARVEGDAFIQQGIHQFLKGDLIRGGHTVFGFQGSWIGLMKSCKLM
jgi:hypothetical protein